jgi:hypothetical protein
MEKFISLAKFFAICKGFGLRGGPENPFPGGDPRGVQPLGIALIIEYWQIH